MTSTVIAQAKLLVKCQGMTFIDIDYNITHTISSEQMQCQFGRNGGWWVKAEPPGSDGNEDYLEVYQTNEEALLYPIANTWQPCSNGIILQQKEVAVDEDEKLKVTRINSFLRSM